MCSPLHPASCVTDVVGAGVGKVAGAVGNAFADVIRGGATWIIKTTIGWWIEVPAIDLEHSPVQIIRGYVAWIAALVAVAGVIWQGMLLVLSRRPEPVFAVVRGLFTLALWTAIGVAGPAAALRAGDAFSSWVLGQAAGGHAADRLILLARMTRVTSPGAVMVLGLVMMLIGLVQAVLMMFRETAVVILAGVVVLAASGSMIGATRPWLPKVLSWMLALICFKPAAALVYASALVLVGESDDVRTVFVGITMMLLATIALPALMRLFTWATGSVGGNGGGLASLAGAAAAGLHAAAALDYDRSRSAQTHADDVRRDLDQGGGAGVGPGGGGRPPDGAQPSGGGRPPGGGQPPSAGPMTSATGSAAPNPTPSSPSAPGGTSQSPPTTSPLQSPASPATPTGGAAPTTATTPTAGTAAPAAGAAAPWLLAAARLTEAARRAADTAADATSAPPTDDDPTRKDTP